MHIPGVIETKKAVGIKAPIKERLTIVYIRKLVAALDTKRYRKLSGAFRINHTTDNQELEHFKRNLWHGRPAICGTDQRPLTP